MEISRREWLAGSLASTVGLPFRQAMAEGFIHDLDLIDCHTHFYDPNRPQGVPWPAKGSSLYRTVLPKHLRELKQFRRVTGTVIVEASPWLEDNEWLLELAKNDRFVVGVIGSLQPGGVDFSMNLKRFAANPLFRGIRVGVQVIKKLLESRTLGDLQLLAESDLALDVNGGPETPRVVGQLGRMLPDLRIVQNHIGNVRVSANRPPEEWQASIRSAARNPNVFCKISALLENSVRNADHQAPVDLEYYRRYLDVVWNAFGEDRVIYGSNWPVSEKASSYETLQKVYLQYAYEKGESATQKFCSLNSLRAYKWVERSGRR